MSWKHSEMVCLFDRDYLRGFEPVVGIVEPSTPVGPLLNAVPNKPFDQRHFSSFPLTSHLHNPILRLLSLHPLLSISCSFLRVPEIHDGYKRRFFISATMTIGDVVDLITGELGLTKTLPIPGSGNLEYVLEEVWLDGSLQSTESPCSMGPNLTFPTRGLKAPARAVGKRYCYVLLRL